MAVGRASWSGRAPSRMTLGRLAACTPPPGRLKKSDRSKGNCGAGGGCVKVPTYRKAVVAAPVEVVVEDVEVLDVLEDDVLDVADGPLGLPPPQPLAPSAITAKNVT